MPNDLRGIELSETFDFLDLEKALQEVGRDPERLENLAGSFESILRNPDTTPGEKARALARCIRERR